MGRVCHSSSPADVGFRHDQIDIGDQPAAARSDACLQVGGAFQQYHFLTRGRECALHEFEVIGKIMLLLGMHQRNRFEVAAHPIWNLLHQAFIPDAFRQRSQQVRAARLAEELPVSPGIQVRCLAGVQQHSR